jgi:hypothetical protein
MGWTTIFRAGTHTDSQGRKRAWTTDDLDRAVASYDPAKREAPLCFGHPKDNAPAYGWVEGLRRVGSDLQARFKQVPDAVRRIVDAGHYKYKSASFFVDGSLRHVALLGAAPPAIEGLGPIQFGADEEYFEYRFQEDTMDEVEKLKKDLADAQAKLTAAETKASTAEAEAKRIGADFSAQQEEQRKAARAAKFKDLVAAGKALPADEAKVVEFAKALGDSGQEICFSAAEGKKDLEAHFWDFMSSRPKHGLFDEFAAPDQSKSLDISNLTAHV